MDKAVIYIHGKGGNAEEAIHYKPLFSDCDVIGLDYTAQFPWEAKEAPHRERKQKYTNHHYSTRYETKNEISEASRNLKQGVTTYQGSANAMGIP